MGQWKISGCSPLNTPVMLEIFSLLVYSRVCLRSGMTRDMHRSAGSKVLDRGTPNIWNRRRLYIVEPLLIIAKNIILY